MPSDRDLAFALGLGLVLLGFGLSSFRMVLGTQRATLDADAALLEGEISDLRKIIGERPSDAFMEAFERRVHALSALGADRGRAARYLGAVAQAVPPGAWLTRLRWTDTTLDLAGRTDDPAGAAEVMDGLRRSRCYDDIVLAGVAGPVGARTFTITARPAADCASLGPPTSDPFAPPIDPEARPDLVLPALVRWEAQTYDVLAIVPGSSATLRDPAGGTHAVQIGSSVGRPPAVVSFITIDQVLLTLDRVVNQDTRETRSTIIELPLEPPTPTPIETDPAP